MMAVSETSEARSRWVFRAGRGVPRTRRRATRDWPGAKPAARKPPVSLSNLWVAASKRMSFRRILMPSRTVQRRTRSRSPLIPTRM